MLIFSINKNALIKKIENMNYNTFVVVKNKDEI